MKNWTHVMAGAAVGLVIWSGAALSQDKPDCSKAGRPENIEGQVVKVDMAQMRITMRAANGVVHEFQASKETLQDYKVGDSIKAKLRPDPRCDK